ncbi:biotin--[acetyl-CoA-carboxylase] ligase [Fodinicurvata sp. EGI_FJ10296]|uniref:biotin--[acetyl-CoA-carboxylase] ligase n=1 Tax=Fodinicurvata sp. EGI_FJ10296 TaxID=3231908 RepID=UPI003453A4FE
MGSGLGHYQPALTGIVAPFGWKVYRAGTTASTNADCVSFAESGGTERSVFWADQQSGGRGRRGREWTSPPGNLYVSILFRPERGLSAALTLGFVAGVALVDTVKIVAPTLDAKVKWPNDVLVDRHKVAGILLESAATGTICDYVVVGIGVNLGIGPPNPSVGLSPGAFKPGSLSDWMTPPPVGEFLGTFLSQLNAVYGNWCEAGFGPIRRRWEACATGIGSTVSVEKGGQRIAGVFSGLDESGAMLIDAMHVNAGHQCVRVTVGDVVFRGAGTVRESECS